MTAPDQRPDGADPDLLAKVFPADTGPLVRTWWICPTCGLERRGGPPATCGSGNPDCPIR